MVILFLLFSFTFNSLYVVLLNFDFVKYFVLLLKRADWTNTPMEGQRGQERERETDRQMKNNKSVDLTYTSDDDVKPT